MQLKPQPNIGTGRPSKGLKVGHAVGMRRWNSMQGTDMITISFVIVEDNEASGDEGKFFHERFAITANAVFRLQQYAHAAGYRDTFDTDNDDDIYAIMCAGFVRANLKEDSYKGKERIEVAGFSAYPSEEKGEWSALVTKGEEVWQAQEARRAQMGGENYSGSNRRQSQGPVDEVPF
jgi:hypothetical protein